MLDTPAPLALDRLDDYSEAAMVAEIRRVARLVARPPYRAAFFVAQSAFRFAHVHRRFGSWAKALERAGLSHLAAPPRRWDWRQKRRRWEVDDAELLDDLRRVAGLRGDDTVREQDLRRHGHHAVQLYARRFGSWHDAARLAGLVPVWLRRAATEAECIDNLRRVWTTLGRPPRAIEMARPPSALTAQVYYRRFGSWTRALRHFVALVNANDNDPLRHALAARPVPPAPPVPREERQAVPVALRHTILTRDRFRCVLCGASPATDPRVTLQLDHIKPFSQGGLSVAENLRTLCAQCNLGRGPHAHARSRRDGSGPCGGLPAMVDQERRQGTVGSGGGDPSCGRRRGGSDA